MRGFNRPGTTIRVSCCWWMVTGLMITFYDQAPIGTEAPLDVDLIDRVEIIRGPGSSLYGANAFFGTINVITKRGRDLAVENFPPRSAAMNPIRPLLLCERYHNGLEFLFSGSFFDSGGHRRLFFKEFNDPARVTALPTMQTATASIIFSQNPLFPISPCKAPTHTGIKVFHGLIRDVFNTTRTRTIDEHGYLDLNYSTSSRNSGISQASLL